MRDGCGKASQRRHALLRSHFLLEAFQFGKVLEIEDVAGGAPLPRAQRRHRDADETLLSIGSLEIELTPLWQLALRSDFARKPEGWPNILNWRSFYFLKLAAGNFFSGAIEQQDVAFRVRGQKPATHRVNNVLVKGLQ